MRKVKKPVFFVVTVLIALFAVVTFIGLHSYYGDTRNTIIKSASEIRWGIDIQGGVNAIFEPLDGYDASKDEMDAAKAIIEQRLINLNITDSEVYVDYNKGNVMVSFPWQSGEKNFDPQAAVAELGETAILTFREGQDQTGAEVINGTQVKKAEAGYINDDATGKVEYIVSLELNDSGKQSFADATTKLAASQGVISIWMDDKMISAPKVNSAITDGKCQISGQESYDEAKALADKINAGSLPFKLVATSTSTVSPTLGTGALKAMVIAGIIAFIAIAIYLIIIYRLPGFVATISLVGQVAGTIACISGFFGSADSFTLTIPGIAGIILAVGMGVDANVLTAERIKEELRKGKTLNGALEIGFKKAWSAVFDGNITVVFVAIILMGAFGPSDSVFAVLLKPIFFMFGASTAGTIYSLGYTLLVGIILNFFFGIFCSRLMLASLSKFNAFRNPALYNGVKKEGGEKKNIPAYEKRKIFYAISTSLAALFVVLTLVVGINVAIEFKGGTLITYSYEGDIDENEISSAVNTAIGETCTVTKGEDFNNGSQTIKLSFSSEEGINSDTQLVLKDALESQFSANNLKVYESTDVSATNGSSFFAKCSVACLFAAIVMVIYIGFRFKNIGGISAGCMAVVALVHDIVMVYGSFVIFRFDINSNFMAVLLTILGYSINATIIIYDRIRENRKLYGNKYSLEQLVDMSVTQTMARSINTTVTTVMAMLTVCIVCAVFGITSIMSFALPLIVGMCFGVYSSNFIAPTLWVMWQKHRGLDKKRDNPAKTI